MVVPKSWKQIDEDKIFRSNLDGFLKESMNFWSWDTHEDTLVAIVSDESRRKQCAVFDGNGKHQYTIPKSGDKVRISHDAIFLYGSREGQLVRISRKTGKEDSFSFPKGIDTFEVDRNGKIWFLYGGYSESEHCVIYNYGTERKLGSISFDQLSTALARTKEDELARPQEEEKEFYRFSEMSRAFDGYTAVYDPKQDALFNSVTKMKLAIDHSSAVPSNNIICLRDWIVLYKKTNVPHDNFSFGTFFVYERKPKWNEYSANVNLVFYTEKFHDVIFGDIRVMDESSFVLETDLGKKLTKYIIPSNRLALPASGERSRLNE